MITNPLMMILVAHPGQFQARGANHSPNPAHDNLPHHILLTTHYPLSNYSLLTTTSPLSFNFHSRRLTIHYPLLTLLFYSTTTHYTSPIANYARPMTRYPLPITHWPLLTSPRSSFLDCSFTAKIPPSLRPLAAPKKRIPLLRPARLPLPDEA